MASTAGYFNIQEFSDAGALLVGGRVYTYTYGTTTHKTAYTDFAGAVPHTYTNDGIGGQYIALNARGELPAPLYLTSGSYDIGLRRADGSTVWTLRADPIADGVASITSSLADTSDVTKGDALEGVKKTTASSVATTQHEVNERTICTFDYMSTAQKADVMAGTFLIDCRAAVQAAVTAAVNGGVKRIHAPGKGYLINGVTSSDTILNGILCPFSVINFNPADQIVFEGDGNGTVFRCGTAGMVMFRMARNCGILRDLTIDGNSLANTWGVGLIPESITQTTATVSDSLCELHNVSRVNLTEGIVIQPGPQVAGSDSGCFYFNVYDGVSNNNLRHVWSKKGSTWATDGNRVTRTNFYGQRFTRGNTGYQFDVGTEVNLFGCHEEIINTGTTPNATPTARIVSSDCVNVNYFGGYAEACTRSVVTPPRVAVTGIAIVHGFGYSFNTGADVSEWNINAESYGDNLGYFPSIALTLSSSGGGTQGGGTITATTKKLGNGLASLVVTGSVAVGTLAAGTLSLAGPSLVPDPAGQRIPCATFAGLTLAAPSTSIGLLLSGGNFLIRKYGGTGADAPLTRGEITGATFDFYFQGIYSY